MFWQHRGVEMRLQTYRLQTVWSLFLFTSHREAQSLNQMAGRFEVHVCIESVLRDIRGNSSAPNQDKGLGPTCQA